MEIQRGPGWKLSADGRKRVPDNYNPYNPEHRRNAETIAFREGDGPAADYRTSHRGYDDDSIPLSTYAVLPPAMALAAAGSVASYPPNQVRMATKGALNRAGLRTPSGIPQSEKTKWFSGKPFWQDATSTARGIGNMTGYRTPSGLSQKEKDFAIANPSDDFLSDAQRKYLDDRKGLLKKGGRTRRVRRTHKRKSGRKSKGRKSRKTLHKRRSRRSRKSRV